MAITVTLTIPTIAQGNTSALDEVENLLTVKGLHENIERLSVRSPATMYAITATVETRVINPGRPTAWHGTREVPTFYLDETVQGITGPNHAAMLARLVIDPLNEIPWDRIHITAVKVKV